MATWLSWPSSTRPGEDHISRTYKWGKQRSLWNPLAWQQEKNDEETK